MTFFFILLSPSHFPQQILIPNLKLELKWQGAVVRFWDESVSLQCQYDTILLFFFIKMVTFFKPSYNKCNLPRKKIKTNDFVHALPWVSSYPKNGTN